MITITTAITTITAAMPPPPLRFAGAAEPEELGRDVYAGGGGVYAGVGRGVYAGGGGVYADVGRGVYAGGGGVPAEPGRGACVQPLLFRCNDFAQQYYPIVCIPGLLHQYFPFPFL
ncbi:hypothetical protein AGMMS49983_11840 [Clostridia bacterium]|nr:hypothetical protein AGMMS49983_11840 [Clostridia bacterium]